MSADDLRDLYQEIILDHNRHPRNFAVPPDANRTAEGYNPLCGDRVRLFVQVEDGRVRDIGFQGSGCAISTASASLMTEALKGKTVDEARELFREFHGLLTGGIAGPETESAGLGNLAALAGVREFPMRVKCATLAWHALQSALEQRDQPVSTE